MFPSVSCAMMDTRQYGHGAGDMNAGDNSSCHHKKVFGLSLFLLSTFPGVAAVLRWCRCQGSHL